MDELISGAVHDPHAVLGGHPEGDRTVIRALRRGAQSVAVVVGEDRHPMTRVHEEGVFEATVPGSGSRATAARSATGTRRRPASTLGTRPR